MGGMLRCIRNEYNLDQVENEINRTDSINYDEVFQSIKQKIAKGMMIYILIYVQKINRY